MSKILTGLGKSFNFRLPQAYIQKWEDLRDKVVYVDIIKEVIDKYWNLYCNK